MPVFDPSTHDDLISITVTLAALASGRASFTRLAVIVDTATPGGGRFATYTSSAEVAADVVAGNLNAIAQEIADVAFAQTARRPADIMFIGVDTGAAETYVQALDAAIAGGADFYGLAIDSRTDADIIAVSNDIESKAASGTFLLFFAQDDDADWLTTGIPAAFSTIEGNERTVMYYHDDNANDATSARLEVAHAAARLAWDPDEKSAGWNATVEDVADLSTALTSTQKGFARANYANTALPFGTTTDTYVDPGKTLGGRPVDYIVSADWLRARVQEDVADVLVAAANKGTKIPVSVTGQSIIGGTMEKRFQQGVANGHFNEYELTPLEITNTDISNQRVRFDAETVWTTGIRQVTIAAYFQTDPLD